MPCRRCVMSSRHSKRSAAWPMLHLLESDLSEALLVFERSEEIVKVAAHAFRVLKKAGHLTGALTALAYLKEAAAKRQLTPETLKAVREYLRRVEREPDLLFAPPPNGPV